MTPSIHFVIFCFKYENCYSPLQLTSANKEEVLLKKDRILILFSHLHKRMGWKVNMMMSHLLLMTFLPKGSKHCNTDGRSMWFPIIMLHSLRRDYFEKRTSFGHIPLFNLGLPMNFSAHSLICLFRWTDWQTDR